MRNCGGDSGNVRDFFGDAGVVDGEDALECAARVGGVESGA